MFISGYISYCVTVIILFKGTKAALIQLKTNNIYERYIELVDNHFDISNVTSFSFEVMVCNDGFVGLAEAYGVRDKNFYEIVLGGYGGKKRFAVRDGISGAHRLESYANDPTLISCTESKPFWVSWSGGVVALGTGATPGVSVVVQWTDPDPHPVNYALISSGFGAVGTWKIYNKDGGWSGWTEWSHCFGLPSVERRVRYCNNPLPELGGNCSGAGEELKPCTANVYWTLLKKRGKMSSAIKEITVRSKIDCCIACLEYATCGGVSYSKTTSSCIVANGNLAVSSLEYSDNWDTWMKH